MSKGFFQDGNGNSSMMRLLTFMVIVICLACLVAAVIYLMVTGDFTLGALGMITSLITSAIVFKWAQKTRE